MLILKKDKARPFKGIVTIELLDRNGKPFKKFIEKNLIVDQARFNLSRFIGNTGESSNYIKTIGFGLGTATPTTADLSLTTPYTKNIDSVTYADNISATFNWSLGLSEANGMAITEFGLIMANGDLFSRKTRAAINKANDFSLNGSWQIIF